MALQLKVLRPVFAAATAGVVYAVCSAVNRDLGVVLAALAGTGVVFLMSDKKNNPPPEPPLP